MKLEETPRLPKLPFLIGDVALIASAWLIAENHPNPYAPVPIMIISVCLITGAILLITPYIINYLRDQEEAALSLRHEMNEQQKKLQSSIDLLTHAAAQLKTLEETSTRQIKAAEQLPYRLQEKIAEFNQQLAQADDDEKQAAAQELAALRTSENERLEKISRSLRDTITEWNRIQTAATALGRNLESTIQTTKAETDSYLAAIKTNTESEIALITSKRADIIESKLSELTTAIDSRIHNMESLAARIEKALRETHSRPTRRRESVSTTAAPSPGDASPPTNDTPTVEISAETAVAAPLPEEPTTEPPPAPTPCEPEAIPVTGPAAPQSESTKPQPIELTAQLSQAIEESPTIAGIETTKNEESLSTPADTKPTPEEPEPDHQQGASISLVETVPIPEILAETVKSPLKAPRKRPQPVDDHPTLGIELPPPTNDELKAERIAAALLRELKAEKSARPAAEEAHIAELITVPVEDETPVESYSQLAPDDMPALHTDPSVDGKTRITITSYIGIGNKLFIRGDGPGLSWDKGIPLQFVSIGRWRWETPDVTSPVNCKIYKNDRFASPVGTLVLHPGNNHEISIAF